MVDLKAEAAKLGAPKVEGGDLYFGNAKAVQDLGDWINAVIRKHFVNVTLFVKSGEPRGHPHPPT